MGTFRKNRQESKSWKNCKTALQPLDVAEAFATSNLSRERLNIALCAISMFRDGNAPGAKKLCEAGDVTEFGDAMEYFAWAQFKALFLKSSLKGDHGKRKAAAIAKFHSSERSCKRVNRRLRFYRRYPERENPVYRVILDRARELISRLLGFPDEHLEEILDAARPGGGVCIGTGKREDVSLPFKLGKTELAVTPDCLPYARMLVETTNWWQLVGEMRWEDGMVKVSVPYKLVPANRIATVPKDASTDRTIAIEPHLNVCLQLGVHSLLTRLLKRVGIDLEEQGHNQHLAEVGSSGWQARDPWVTMDLKSASDSVSIALVERLFPTGWCNFLGALRSPSYQLDGQIIEYQKWSSMGNGYTFALESLIFWALGTACTSYLRTSDRVYVYGDDIVCRRHCAALFIEVLAYVGFRVNSEKTFLFGPFRESCGEDRFNGVRVTPLYLRGMSVLLLTDIHRALNRARVLPGRWGDVRSLLFDHYRRASRHILKGLENEDESSCVFVPLHEARAGNHIKWNPYIQTWTFLVAEFKPKLGRSEVDWSYAASLFGYRSPVFGKGWMAHRRGSGRWALVRRTPGVVNPRDMDERPLNGG